MTVGGINIHDFCSKSIKDALAFIDGLELSDRDMMIADAIIKEIKSRKTR